MQLRPPASGARVGEDGSSLLDCTRASRGNVSVSAGGKQVGCERCFPGEGPLTLEHI